MGTDLRERELPVGAAGRPAVEMPCRFCRAQLRHIFCDLGMSPLSNSYLRRDQLTRMEPFYPLRALVCEECRLVQLEEYETPQAIFSDYAYFSSYSTSWVEHSRRYAEEAIERFGLGPDSHVVEVGSNDGYLLRWFRGRDISVLGIEPAENVARDAIQLGVPTLVEFFGLETATQLASKWSADLLIGNNVLAHVPDLNDFVEGMRVLLAPGGTISMEFPHLLRLIDNNEFDTIYHEHFSYFSFATVGRIFRAHGMDVYDVEELPTHGGSLRIFAGHADAGWRPSERATALLEREREAGLEDLDRYLRFEEGARRAKREILATLISWKDEGRRIAGYGAPAKGNTLLNYCGVGTDLIDFTVDMNPHKQGTFLPGTHIPVRAPDALREERPDVVLILPWNLRDEIVEQHSYVREWGGRFAVPIPRMALVE